MGGGRLWGVGGLGGSGKGEGGVCWGTSRFEEFCHSET